MSDSVQRRIKALEGRESLAMGWCGGVRARPPTMPRSGAGLVLTMT